MKFDLKKRRKRLKISCADIARQFGGTRQKWSHHDREGSYPLFVKEWMDIQEANKDGDRFSLKKMIKKYLSMSEDHEQRIKELEQRLNSEDN